MARKRAVEGEPEAPTGLIDPSRFRRVKLSQLDMAEWVVSNLRTAGLRPEDAPNAECWVYLMECRENPDVRKDFLKLRMARKAEDDARERPKDDGSADEELIDRLEHALSGDGAEGFVRESRHAAKGVSAGASASGVGETVVDDVRT